MRTFEKSDSCRKTVIYSLLIDNAILRIKNLPEGKLPISVLSKILGSLEGASLVVRPKVGIDVGVWRARGRFVVSSSDPITGTGRRIGWHAVNVCANDVSTSGIMPEVLSVVALFPRSTGSRIIQRVISEINRTAVKLGISVAGGHTEITPGIGRPIIVVTAIGSGNRFVTAADARAQDIILMTKTAGIEGTAILSNLAKVRKMVGQRTANNGSNLIKKLSIVKEAGIAFQTGKVHAMHDATEGGILGAVYEMSLASNLGFAIDDVAIPVDAATRDLCSKLRIDPLRLIGSGSLIIACGKGAEKEIAEELQSNGIPCTEIGQFLQRGQGHILRRGNESVTITEGWIQDELWRALRKYGDLS